MILQNGFSHGINRNKNKITININVTIVIKAYKLKSINSLRTKINLYT